MIVIVNNIVGKVEWERFRKARTPEGPTVVMGFQVAYLDADAFADGVMGGYLSTGGPSGTVKYIPRLACPTNTQLYAISAEVEYIGERSDAIPNFTPPAQAPPPQIAFDTAIVVVNFANPRIPQQITDDSGGEQSFPLDAGQPILFAECEIDHGGGFITLPKGALKFASDGLKLSAGDPGIGQWEGIDVWRITRSNFPNLPYVVVRGLKNKVNSATFLGQPKGCIRFANARTKGMMTGQGFKCQQFEMTFEVKDQDWNMFIRPDSLQYDTVCSATDGMPTNFPYKYADISKLLR